VVVAILKQTLRDSSPLMVSRELFLPSKLMNGQPLQDKM